MDDLRAVDWRTIAREVEANNILNNKTSLVCYLFYMYVKVRVYTGVKKEEVRLVSENRLSISVKQKPVQNLANRRVIELVAYHYKTPVKKVRIVSGHQSPSKILSVD